MTVVQADGEGARRLAEPRPVAAGQRAATAGPRAQHPASSHALFPHHARLRFAGDRRCHDCHPELPQRDDQVRRQELPGCRRRRVRDGRRWPQDEGKGRHYSQIEPP